jgi:hypothetical protein
VSHYAGLLLIWPTRVDSSGRKEGVWSLPTVCRCDFFYSAGMRDGEDAAPLLTRSATASAVEFLWADSGYHAHQVDAAVAKNPRATARSSKRSDDVACPRVFAGARRRSTPDGLLLRATHSLQPPTPTRAVATTNSDARSPATRPRRFDLSTSKPIGTGVSKKDLCSLSNCSCGTEYT